MPTVAESMVTVLAFSRVKWMPLVVGYLGRPALIGKTFAVLLAPDPVAGVDPVQVHVEGDLGAARPVRPRPVVDLLVVEPAPGAVDLAGGGHVQAPLDRGTVADRLAEEDRDRHADADGLTVQRHHRGVQQRGRLQGRERAGP